MERIARNWREWVSRYGWAAIWGLVTSYLGYLAGAEVGGSTLSGAFAASLGENIGYYGCVIWREIKLRLSSGERLSVLMLRRTAGDLLYEFGLPESLDFLIVRPGTTYTAVTLFGPAFGVIIGKVIADAVFYVLTITFYERRKAHKAKQ